MKILILSSSAGNGHNSAGNRIKEKFLKEQPSSEIEMVDIYKSYASKLNAWIIEKGYFFACNHLLPLYNHYFKKSEHEDFKYKDGFGCHKQIYSMMHGILNKIYEYKPDLIICTYIFSSIAIANLKRIYNIPAKVACMTLDYGVSPYWECTCDALDYMFLTDEYMVEPFIKRGFSRNQLFVTGIPISYQFYEERNKIETRKALKLDENLFTIVVMKASFFPIKEKKLVKSLSKVNKQIQIVFINGKDEKSKKKIDKYVKKYKLKHVVHNIGFTKQIPEYFSACDLVLGKAGGLTTTETITCGLPSLILNKLPMQEIYNKNFLVEKGCALEVTSKTLTDKINYLIDNPNEYKKMVESAIKTRKMYAVNNLYEVLKNVPKASYDNLTLNETKKQVIKRVHKQRKLDLKKAKAIK